MSWLAVALVTALFLALWLRVAYWLGGFFADAELFLEREQRCTCAKGRVCAACLAASEALRPSPKPTTKGGLS